MTGASGGGPPLHAVRSGRSNVATGETFVLLHGFGATSFTWRHWLPALERRGHVVRIDLQGFGGSPKPTGGRYGPVEQARLVTDTIRSLGLERPILIGHSLGGGIALLTALLLHDADTPAESLIVIAGAAYRQRLPPFVRLAQYPSASATLLSGVGPRIVVGQVLRSIVFDPGVVTTEMVEGYAMPLASPEAVRALIECAGQIEPPDLDEITARYAELDLPTLLMWGRHDRVVPPWVGERLARTLPRARLVVLERCGHVPQEEVPEASLAEVEAFLDV